MEMKPVPWSGWILIFTKRKCWWIPRWYRDSSTTLFLLMNPGSFHNVNFIGIDQGLDYFTTDDQASRGRIIACPTGQDFRKANEVVPQQDRILQSACLVQGQLVCFYLNDGVCELYLIDPRHSRSCPIPLPDPCGTITLLSEIPLSIRSGSPFLFFQFQSFQFPPCILRLSVAASKVEPLQKIASHTSFCVEKVAIAARDTTRLLAFLAYDPQQGPVESMPAIMYGYGGFAVCNTPIATNPVLHMDIAEWVRRGGLYIQCIVRGGGEFGEQWHQQGIGENKIHAVHDFIDIAQELIRRRLCHPDRLAAVGGSGRRHSRDLSDQRSDLSGLHADSHPGRGGLRLLLAFRFQSHGKTGSVTARPLAEKRPSEKIIPKAFWRYQGVSLRISFSMLTRLST